MANRADKQGMLGYSWVYWAAIAAAFALLIVDLFDDGAIWNYGVVVCIIIATAVRPGGVRGRRAAAAAKEEAPRATYLVGSTARTVASARADLRRAAAAAGVGAMPTRRPLLARAARARATRA